MCVGTGQKDRSVGTGEAVEEGLGSRGTGTDSGSVLGLRWTRNGSLCDYDTEALDLAGWDRVQQLKARKQRSTAV